MKARVCREIQRPDPRYARNVPIACRDTLVRPGDLVVAAAVVKSVRVESPTAEDANRQRFASGEVSLDVSNLRPLLEQLGVRTSATAIDAAVETAADGVR